MDVVRQYHDKYFAQADRELSKVTLLRTAEQRFKVPKVYLALGVAVVAFLLVSLNFGGTLITNLVGYVYPAWSSLYAIESPGKDDDTQWLVYWTVFSFFNVIEYFSNVLLYWIPFYYVFKLVVLLWLSLPQTRGAEYLYQAYIRPVFIHHTSRGGSTRFDEEFVRNTKEQLEEVAEKVKPHSN
ncbi:ER membrane protein DP1/Yop1 [Dispira parvispora]|uniref:Protein YOP1 n=1 Tax=Dispira parvispora TaxID=1520584 RepID=A0A9W8AQY3_9FUNG|nr:ER membrane protein DP1/Yop1 [Dispira parvispora]